MTKYTAEYEVVDVWGMATQYGSYEFEAKDSAEAMNLWAKYRDDYRLNNFGEYISLIDLKVNHSTAFDYGDYVMDMTKKILGQ